MKKEDLQMLLFPSMFRLLAKGVFAKCLFSFLFFPLFSVFPARSALRFCKVQISENCYNRES